MVTLRRKSLFAFAALTACFALFPVAAHAIPAGSKEIKRPVEPAGPGTQPAATNVIKPSETTHRGAADTPMYQLSIRRVVTSSYLRMHRSGMLISMAKEVAAGKVRPHRLITLAGPGYASALTATKWNSLTVRRKIAHLPYNGNKPPDPNHPIGNVMSWDTVRQIVPVSFNQLPATDYGPHSVDVGEQKIGTVITRTISLICPADSTVTASPEKKYRGALSVTNMASYDGTWVPDNPKERLHPHPDKTAAPGESLPALAGQDITVEIRIASDDVNVIDTNVDITGTYGAEAWSVKIPVHAIYTILGPIKTVIPVPGNRDVCVLAGQSIKVPVQLLNISPNATTATLSVSNLPDSITVDPVTVNIPANATGTATLKFVVDPQATEDIGHSLDVVCNATGLGPSHAGMSFSIYDPIHEFDLSNGVSAGHVGVFFCTVGIQSDGGWYLDGTANDFSQLSGDKATIGFAFPGENGVGHGHWQTFNFGPNDLESIDMSGTSKWVLDNYLSIVTVTPFMYMMVNDPSSSASDTLSLMANGIQVLSVIALF